MSARNVLANALLSVAGIAVALLLLEGALRVYNPFPFRMRGDEIVLPQFLRYEIDDVRANGLDSPIVHTKNALGFRGPMPPEDWDDNLTIVAVGGSTTECFYLSDGRDWPAQLGLRLDAAFRDVWVQNAGLDGHSTFGHLVLMRQVVASMRPDVVLFLVGINDIGLEVARSDDARLTPEPIWGNPAAIVRSMAGVSEVAALAQNLYRYWHTVRWQLAHRELVVPEDPEDFRPPLAAMPVPPGIVASHGELRDAYRGRLVALATLSMESGILPVFVTQPLLLGEGADPRTGVDLSRVQIRMLGLTLDGATQWRLMESYNDVVREVGTELAIPVIDLARALPKTTAYFYDPVHYNNAGAEAVAAIVAGHLCPILADWRPEFRTGDCAMASRAP